MPNTRIAGPTYTRLKKRRDEMAADYDRQVTVTEVIAELLDIAEAFDAAAAAAYTAGRDRQPPPVGRHTRPYGHEAADQTGGATR